MFLQNIVRMGRYTVEVTDGNSPALSKWKTERPNSSKGKMGNAGTTVCPCVSEAYPGKPLLRQLCALRRLGDDSGGGRGL